MTKNGTFAVETLHHRTAIRAETIYPFQSKLEDKGLKIQQRFAHIPNSFASSYFKKVDVQNSAQLERIFEHQHE